MWQPVHNSQSNIREISHRMNWENAWRSSYRHDEPSFPPSLISLSRPYLHCDRTFPLWRKENQQQIPDQRGGGQQLLGGGGVKLGRQSSDSAVQNRHLHWLAESSPKSNLCQRHQTFFGWRAQELNSTWTQTGEARDPVQQSEMHVLLCPVDHRGGSQK